MQTVRSFVGMDVHKETISISVAEDGRNGPVRFLGVIPNAADDVAKLAKRLSKHGELDFCYEASGCGYGIHRQLTALGHKCIVVAPSMIPRKPGERIKTDRRDSEKLAILHRSGDLTPVWVPDTTHEALRDLVRARVDASMHLMRARQQLLAFLLRHGRSYPTGKHWTQRHRSWLAGQTFHEHAHGIVFQDYLETVWTAQQRRDSLIERISAMVGMRYAVDLRHPLQAPCGVGSSNQSGPFAIALKINPSSKRWECGNPEGISKRSGKGGKPVLLAFHAFHSLSFPPCVLPLRVRTSEIIIAAKRFRLMF